MSLYLLIHEKELVAIGKHSPSKQVHFTLVKMVPVVAMICALLLNEIISTGSQAMLGEHCKTEDGLVKDLLLKIKDFERFRWDATNKLKKLETELQDTRYRLAEVEKQFGKRVFLFHITQYIL